MRNTKLGKYMTKKDAERLFRQEIYPGLDKADRPACREAWNNFVDSLHKDGKITEYQINTWVQPKYIAYKK